MSPAKSVSATRTIPASPGAIFDLLATPEEHVKLDGSGSVIGVKSGPERLSIGATFSMQMKMGASYKVNNVVKVFEPNKAIAWYHAKPLVWRYDLEEDAGGTKVTETFTYQGVRGFLIGLIGVPKKNQASMEKTLALLETAVTS